MVTWYDLMICSVQTIRSKVCVITQTGNELGTKVDAVLLNNFYKVTFSLQCLTKHNRVQTHQNKSFVNLNQKKNRQADLQIKRSSPLVKNQHGQQTSACDEFNKTRQFPPDIALLIMKQICGSSALQRPIQIEPI